MPSRPLRTLGLALLTLLLTGASLASAAAPLDPKKVPDPLKPWTEWVLSSAADAACPRLEGKKDAVSCAWPARLEASVDEHGARFTQRWHLDAARWVPLPGDEKRWPLDVKVDGKAAVVVKQASAPSVRLEPGDHLVAGSLAWDTLPESLRVPVETGLLALTLKGAPIASPQRDAQGNVFLQKTGTQEEGERLEIVAHRKIIDDIPLILETQIELNVAGKSREVLLGKVLPPGFVPMSLDGQVPARVEPDSRLRVQIRPGRWTIKVVARSEGAVASIKRPEPDGPWQEGEEVWAFEAKPDLRLVELKGPPSIDPAQTRLPDAWKRLPAFPMKVGGELTFSEQRRGEVNPPPDQLTLSRSLWLDFEGTGYTISDTVRGTFNRDTRLEMAAPTTLGRVAIAGRDQFITHLPGGAQRGVEVRQGPIELSADSRVTGDVGDLPAVGWNSDFHQVSATLHLPPGWRLLHASGVDDVRATWVRQWSLLQIFLALVLALAIARLHGWRWGVIALIMLTLTLPEDDAPRWIWVPVLVTEALARVLPNGGLEKFVRGLRGATLALATIIAIPFLVQQVREGLHPVLAAESVDLAGGAAVRSVDHAGGAKNGAKTDDTTSAFGAGEPRAAVAPAPSEPKQAPTEGSTAKSEARDGVEDEPKRAVPATREAPGARGLSNSLSPPASPVVQPRSPKFYADAYDPSVIVQTGPGLPKWNWTSIPLSWSGPVSAAQRLTVWLVPPGVNLALAIARLLLLALVLLRISALPLRFWPSGWGPKATGVASGILLAIGLTFAPATARAQIPDPAMLTELRERLLGAPDCQPSCASIGRLVLQLDALSLRGRIEVSAATATALALPGIASQWLPDQVMVDGQPAKALLRTPDGVLWVAVTAGTHQVTFSGPSPAAVSVQLPLHHQPHRVEVTADGWRIAGVHEDGLADENLQFTRIAKSTDAGGELQPGALPAFVRVERTLHIGLQWQVDTRVVRATPTGTAVVVEVPLLSGESVTSADVRVVKGAAQVNMAPDATTVEWHSVMEQRSPITLAAPKALAWTEVWRVDVGPMWHGAFSGIPQVHTQVSGGGPVLPEWRPWPSEEATIALTRPDGVAGQSLTIDASSLDLSPGLRATDATLTLQIRASRGSSHTITLPQGARLESLMVNGTSQPVRQQDRQVTLAIVPGAQSVALKWRQPTAFGVYFRTPEVDLGAPSVNASLKVTTTSRWVLYLGGPQMGPAVLYWSMLAVMLLVAVGLGRLAWTPLRWWQWMWLTVGLSQVDIILGALFAGWLIALGWRKARPELPANRFNLRQVLLVVSTLVALVILGVAIYQGLLGTPEMNVRGNGSDSGNLRWFTDRAGPILPEATVLSLPLMAYRVAMLAWALWIAVAVLRWLRFGWSAFAEGGLWKHSPPLQRQPIGVQGAPAADLGHAPAPGTPSEGAATHGDSTLGSPTAPDDPSP